MKRKISLYASNKVKEQGIFQILTEMALIGTIKWYISMPDDWLWEFVYINLDPNIVRRIFDDSRRPTTYYPLTF